MSHGPQDTQYKQATDSMDKIILKSGPKQFKRGPGLTGEARLRQRVRHLIWEAARAERKPDLEPFARKVREALQSVL